MNDKIVSLEESILRMKEMHARDMRKRKEEYARDLEKVAQVAQEREARIQEARRLKLAEANDK